MSDTLSINTSPRSRPSLANNMSSDPSASSLSSSSQVVPAEIHSMSTGPFADSLHQTPSPSPEDHTLHSSSPPSVDPHEVAAGSSLNASVFILSATTLGAGILALPYAMSLLGWIFGALLLLGVGFFSSYAIHLLMCAASKAGVMSYEDLGAVAYPKHGRKVVVSFTLVLIFGSLTAFLVIIADTVTPALRNIVGSTSGWYLSREFLLVLVTILVVLPLSMLRSVHQLEKWSFLAVGIIFGFSIVVIGVTIHKFANHTVGPDGDGNYHISNVQLFRMNLQFFEALPIISLAFTCQTMIFPIWQNLEKPAPVVKMKTVVNRSLFLCGTLYTIVGVFAYFSFAATTKSDILNNFPIDSVWYDVVRLLFAVAICIHYPVVHFSFRASVQSTWFHDRPNTTLRHVVLTIIVVIASLLLALALPNLSTVFSLTGALCAFPYCFVMPALFYLKVHERYLLHGHGRKFIENDHSDDALASEVPTEDETVTESDADTHGVKHVQGSNGSLTQKTKSHHRPLLAEHRVRVDGSTDHDIHPEEPEAHPDHVEMNHLAEPSSGMCFNILPKSKRIPPIVLLVTATIIWIASVVVAFKDTINTLKTQGLGASGS